MNRAEGYLKRAEQCRQKAKADSNAASAERWLKMATNYEDLARNYFIFNRLLGSNVPAE